MSIFTAAVDNHITQLKQLGENGHIEWGEEKGIMSNDFKERITQFQFQCVRCDLSALNKLETQLRGILSDNFLHNTKEQSLFLSVLYKIIGQTRDIESGKGERQLSYMMILVWWEFYPELAKFALACFVKMDENMPYGSWKDIKKMCQYVFEKTLHIDHPLILYGIELICEQLRLDSHILTNSALSLCSRWVPRESSKKGRWLFRAIAETYFPEFIATAKNEVSLEKAKRKTYMTFGRLISSMNKRLDTVQIKMCGKTWAEIDHNKTTSVTIMKNRGAFMNNSKKYKNSDDPDRIQCAENFKTYIESRVSKGVHVKGKRIGIVDFVVEGLKISYSDNQLEIDTVNSQWSSFMEQVGDLENMVAMVDQSGSMSGDPYHAAVGLGIAVASKSALGKRIMTFSYEPAWVNLENCNDFMSYITEIKKVDHLAGFGTNFFKAQKLILDACVSGNVPDSVVRNMTLAIFSDMQIDEFSITEPEGDYFNSRYSGSGSSISFQSKMLTMHERISEMYLAAGYSGTPHILFWNLRHTSGYPTKSSMKNATMFSGFSPMILNSFCNKGAEALIESTPWDALLDSLSNERYDILEKKCMDLHI